MRPITLFLLLLTLSLPTAAMARDPERDGEVILTTEHSFYQVGEKVRFTLANDRDQKISDFQGFSIYPQTDSDTLDEDDLIFDSHTAFPEHLPAGRSATFTWNMRDKHGNPVKPGRYSASYWYSYKNVDEGMDPVDADTSDGEATVGFELLPSANGRIIFRTTKTEYRKFRRGKGETVRFYLLNRSSRRVTLPTSDPYTVYQEGPRNTVREILAPTPGADSIPVPALGGRIMFSWDQRDDVGSPVSTGSYHVRITVRPSGARRGVLWSYKTPTFRIVN